MVPALPLPPAPADGPHPGPPCAGLLGRGRASSPSGRCCVRRGSPCPWRRPAWEVGGTGGDRLPVGARPARAAARHLLAGRPRGGSEPPSEAGSPRPSVLLLRCLPASFFPFVKRDFGNSEFLTGVVTVFHTLTSQHALLGQFCSFKRNDILDVFCIRRDLSVGCVVSRRHGWRCPGPESASAAARRVSCGAGGRSWDGPGQRLAGREHEINVGVKNTVLSDLLWVRA